MNQRHQDKPYAKLALPKRCNGCRLICNKTLKMKLTIFSLWAILLLFLSSCKAEVLPPKAEGVASPEAVALSLATVDPKKSLHLFEYDRAAPLNIQEEARWYEDNAEWIDFSYESSMGGRVDARLIIPPGNGPFPGMILQHGGGGAATLEDMDYFAREFVDHGAVTIMITDPYRRPGGWVPTPYMGNTWPLFTESDLRIKIQLILDQRRAIDILESRPEVDSDRLAYFGVSFGGMMGGLLAGVEDRLKAYVLVVGDGGLVEHTADPGEDGLNIHFSEEWAALMWPTESLHFVGRAAPAALLFQNGINDMHVPAHDAIRYYTAASEPKTIMWYDAGHGLPWRFVNDAAEWLQPYLGDNLLLLTPNYRPSAIIWDRILFILIITGLGIYLWKSIRRKYLSWGDRLLWFLAVIWTGPVGLALFWFIARRPKNDRERTQLWVQALGVAVLSVTAFVSADFMGDKVNSLLQGSDFRIQLAQTYLMMLVGGVFLTLLARRTYRAPIFAHILSANTFWAVAMLLPWLVYEFFQDFSQVNSSANALVGIVLTTPLNYWLIKDGFERWVLDLDLETSHPPLKRLPVPLIAGILVLSFGMALGSILMMLKLYTGLSWNEVLLIIRGVYR